VLDAVALLAPGADAAGITHDGGSTLTVRLARPFQPPAVLPDGASEAELATCQGCVRIEALPGGALRVRASGVGHLQAGALDFTSADARRIRWDVTIAP